MRLRNTDQGFTLIELLIVIVIIGILSGLLIGLINPARQQARSRNATIQSAISKVAYGVNAARSATGSLPSADTLDDELENISPVTDRCVSGGYECNFTIPGIRLPETCGDASAGAYATGDGSTACEFRYIADTAANSNKFAVMGKKWELGGDDAASFYYYHSTEGFYECPATVTITTAIVASDTDAVPDGCTLITD